MKKSRFAKIPPAPRVFLPIFWATVCVAMLAAPLLQAHGYSLAAALVYALFAPVCHQNPTRSFFLLGGKWAVCHRCSGIYLGLFLASLVPYDLSVVIGSARWRKVWIICATVPLLLDVLLPFAGLWHNTPASRVASGMLFGAMLSSLLASALAELVHEAPWKRSRHNADAVGGLS
jgi:uncharacterized membrane protein